jgi:hypothetical protein
MIRPLALIFLAGCLAKFPESPPGDSGTAPTVDDADGDGFTVAEGDCNDDDDAVHPNANERCDGVDNDCNNDIDDDAIDASLFYADDDQDDFGDPNDAVTECDPPSGYVADDQDCDDTDAAINPDADEICDTFDNDCDQNADGGAIDATTWYLDLDDDSFGADATAVDACDPPTDEYVDIGGDCDDLDVVANPDGTEVCGGGDEDCDTFADDLDPDITGRPLWYPDDDLDGFGDDFAAGVPACVQPADTVGVQGDCNDGSAAFNPNAPETDCTDPADYNCDGATGFADGDGDGFAACAECDDGNPNANPGEQEICDAGNVDEDCDGAADDLDVQGATGRVSTYPDGDLDTFGQEGAAAVPKCDVVPGISANDLDCDDSDAQVNPGEIEICDPLDVDEDCNGDADDADANPAGELVFYQDNDGDGFGTTLLPTVQQCDVSAGLSALDTDCDDGRMLVNPGADEVCDAVDRDEDCDGGGDDADPQGADSGTTPFYTDGDVDGFGDDATVRQGCDILGPEILVGGDCDDGDVAINPSATEVCDPGDTDEDCDGGADDADPESAAGGSSFAPDADGDGFGDASAAPRAGCDPTGNEVADTTDCNDSSAAAFPGATELCNGVQDNCSDAGWTDDDGIVTTDTLAGIQDLTASFAAGAPGAPAAVALPGNGTVTICPGTYQVALSATGTVDVAGFSGVAGDVVLSGEDTSRVLMLGVNATVSLTDLTLSSGFAVDGGAVNVPVGADLTATDCVFDGNAATNGGALMVRGAATLSNNAFTANTADLGAGIYVEGSVTANGDDLTSNAATSAGGGWYLDAGGTVDAVNVATTLNTAPIGAGGQVQDGTFDCSGLSGSFVNNVATTSGGGLELIAGSIISTTCDWAPGNTPDDVHTPVSTEFYGLNASFTCDVFAGCTP